MTRFGIAPQSCRFLLAAIILSCAPSLLIAAQTTTDNHFLAISDSGQQLNSVFDGLTPNQQVRDTLVLKTHNLANLNLSNFGSSGMRAMLGLGPKANASSCPTGGICAQPGTTSTPGQFCEDSSGCDVDVNNQTTTENQNSGTMELYDCEQCCVDWAACTLGDGGGPGNLCPPGDHDPLQDGGCNPSPIIVDAQAEGFHLTSAANGVSFDITGDGHPLEIAWTDPHYHNAFLALPGADGLVHTGKELFGNFTPQPPSEHPNGFIALAQYDKPENGGNSDGIIDDRDEVFSKLRLWIDENHDGICQPNELHRLPELGVYSLALSYTESRRTDEWGNQFRYKAQVNPGDRKDPRDQTPTGDPGRWTYDVFFVVK